MSADPSMSRRRFLRLAGATACATACATASVITLDSLVLGGCAHTGGYTPKRHVYSHSELLDRFNLESRDFTEEECSALSASAHTKMEFIYFMLTGKTGDENDFQRYAETLVETGTDLSFYASNIEKLLRLRGIDERLAREVFPSLQGDQNGEAEHGSNKYGCTIDMEFSDNIYAVELYSPDKFYLKRAGHETAHSITQREDWANYLSLKGALESRDDRWIFSCLEHLYRTIHKLRFSIPPSNCITGIKKKWPEYHEGYLRLVLADNDLRAYFGMEMLE